MSNKIALRALTLAIIATFHTAKPDVDEIFSSALARAQADHRKMKLVITFSNGTKMSCKEIIRTFGSSPLMATNEAIGAFVGCAALDGKYSARVKEELEAMSSSSPCTDPVHLARTEQFEALETCAKLYPFWTTYKLMEMTVSNDTTE